MSALEDKIKAEFSAINSVWNAFHYAKNNDPSPGFTPSRRYYLPSTAKEIKNMLKKDYPQSATQINKMNAKQARMIYHTINKFLSKSFIDE